MGFNKRRKKTIESEFERTEKLITKYYEDRQK